MAPAHLVLLGDSILDNGAYTQGGPDVLAQVRRLLPQSWRASSLAVDGSTIADLRAQLAKLPEDATHLVIAIGGNDVLGHRDMLNLPVATTADALTLFARRVAQFEKDYRAAIGAVVALKKTVVLATIYNGNLEPSEAQFARTALVLFDDVILRVAMEKGLSVIELRLVCTEANDYANSIEPSVIGGGKIAHAIVQAFGLAERPPRVTHIYAQ